jgi:hypothetical protein
MNQAIIVAAILLAGCAAFFSVTGLGNLFNSFSVMFMAGSLELAKLLTAAYLKTRWYELGRLLRIYLTAAVIVLMFITSMGIYAFLSDAFQNQNIRLEQVGREVLLLENKININKAEINRYTKQNEINNNIRNSQEQNLSKLIDDKRGTGRISTMIQNADIEIIINSKKIDSLNTLNVLIYNSIDSVKNKNIDLEKEVGGFRFVAQTFNVSLNTAVNWFILMIVFVFDPLAIALVLAFNTKRKKIEPEIEKSEIVPIVPLQPEPDIIQTESLFTEVPYLGGDYFGECDYTENHFLGHEYVPDMLDVPLPLQVLIEEGVVDLKFYETTPEHAKEYGIQANKPLYVQNLIVLEKERLKGIGKKVLHNLENYANENGNDIIFGYLADESSFSRDSRQSFYSDIDMIKNWLHNNGYAINNATNEFHKVVKTNIKYDLEETLEKNNNMYKVSLIVPSYLRPERTQRVIECILNQDFVGFEAYIVGDNCPFIQKLVDEGKQKEYAKIAESKGNKLAIFNMPIHYGGYGYQARNTCVKLAIGDYTMFMDNDDVIEPDHISNYYNAIAKTENDLMFFNSWLDPIEIRGTRGKIRETKIEEGMIGHAEIIVRTSLLKSLKPQTPEYNHDWTYLMQILNAGAVYEKSHNKPTYKIMGVGELRETSID